LAYANNFLGSPFKISRAIKRKMPDPSCVFYATRRPNRLFLYLFFLARHHQLTRPREGTGVKSDEEDVTALKATEQVEFWQILATVK
jgi:hypothetical protein